MSSYSPFFSSLLLPSPPSILLCPFHLLFLLCLLDIFSIPFPLLLFFFSHLSSFNSFHQLLFIFFLYLWLLFCLPLLHHLFIFIIFYFFISLLFFFSSCYLVHERRQFFIWVFALTLYHSHIFWIISFNFFSPVHFSDFFHSYCCYLCYCFFHFWFFSDHG